jgi:hypothetical protein
LIPGGLLLDDGELDEAIAAVLGLDPRTSGFEVEITLRVLDDPESGGAAGGEGPPGP